MEGSAEHLGWKPLTSGETLGDCFLRLLCTVQVSVMKSWHRAQAGAKVLTI